jgi:DNA-binding MarR family transcriptional regulator
LRAQVLGRSVGGVTEKLSDLEMDAWQALLHAHHKILRALDAELRAEHELTLGDYDVLLRLARAPDRRLRMTELAQRVMISPSGLTRVVDGLVEEGYVERQRDDGDARVVYARLTDAGRDRVRRAAQTHLRGIREHFTGRLTETQLRQLASALQVISGPHVPH